MEPAIGIAPSSSRCSAAIKTSRGLDSKDLDETMASARQTIAQVESFLRQGREQLGQQAKLLGECAITGDVISRFVEAQDDSFRQAYTCERQAALREINNLTSIQLAVFRPRVKPMRLRV
ncbi:hypothetical protein EBB04_32905 [Sinorhizobium meliloti]|nr:hypothetical protein EBB04_32905 [Sinorhizobium meliloti]